MAKNKKWSARISKAILRLFGWRVEYTLPDSEKFVLLAVPHTSNWDLVVMLLASYVMGIEFKWAAKDSLFKGLFGRYMLWLGGVPVNRRKRTNFVDQIAGQIKSHDRFAFVIAPDGTRSKVPYWKSGFYRIALAAQVPIAMGYEDWEKKVAGIGPSFMPSGNIPEDMQRLRDFYAGMKGKIPENQGPVRLKEEMQNPGGES